MDVLRDISADPWLTNIPERIDVTRVHGEQNAVFCSRRIPVVNPSCSQNLSATGLVPFMSGSLFDAKGNRKYLTARERLAFVCAASKKPAAISTFCLTMAFTGARISEVLALTATRIDAADEAIIFETLKQRKKRVFRAVPVWDRPSPICIGRFGISTSSVTKSWCEAKRRERQRRNSGERSRQAKASIQWLSISSPYRTEGWPLPITWKTG